ncbi:MAG: molybdenum cofactor guanylyltransferase [Rubripirellula sp.]
MSERLLGVVLCGGRSSRMGRDKSALPYPSDSSSGGTFLSHAIDRMNQVCDDVVISGNADFPPYVSIPDPVAHRGPVVGIAATLTFAADKNFGACFFIPVDVPDFSINDLQDLKSTWRETGQTTLAVSDRTEPLIGIYSVSNLPELDRLAASEDRSLFRFFRRGAVSHSTVSIDPLRCRNINTPEDLEHHGQ